jgi:predicted RecA/RadA family phage recombinase
MKNAVHDGKTMPYTNGGGSTLPSGRVVKIGNILGVLVKDAEPGETVTAYIEGVYDVPKVSAAVFVQGEKLLFDVSAGSGVGAFDDSAATPASGDLMGAAIAYAAGGNGETTCRVKLTPGNSTLTA